MKFLQSPSWRIILIALATGLAWALATGQEWEDLYITYRASKNFAEGNGLTFTEGERVHSFTSPLGVLLPAVSYLLTGRTSDVGALWLFRLMSWLAWSGAAVLMWQALRRFYPATVAPAAWLVAMLLLDSKTICFVTSGMETAFMLLFLGWGMWAVFLRPPRLACHVGLAWAGLMWTRPDSCVYIAAFALGLLLFAPGEGGYLRSRLQWLRTVFLAGILCAIVYLPWFLWAWSYYGTPVPHTITAKGLFNEMSVQKLIRGILHFPQTILHGQSSLKSTFTPYYSGIPDGFAWFPTFAFTVAFVPLILFLLPFVRWEVRFTSFVYALGHVYLTVVIGFPVPWYVPHVTFLGLVALALVFGQLGSWVARKHEDRDLLAAVSPWFFRAGGTAALVTLLAAASMTVVMARQAYLEMTIIEKTVRSAIGHWLREQADSPRETVFLEPLGFIGYFSGLKMLDFPGLCSPEVVAARRRATNRSYPFSWGELIPMLRPDWLVLRPWELAEVNKNDHRVIPSMYDLVKTFDATPDINTATLIPIKGYLEYNGTFHVYRLKERTRLRARGYAPLWSSISVASLTTKESPLPVEPAGNGLKAHAPSRLIHPVPSGAALLLGGFGIYEGAYAKPRPEATDGAEFVIEHVSPQGSRTTLLQRLLDPSNQAADQGLQPFEVDLPSRSAGEIVFTVNPGPSGSNSYDWSYWYDMRFGTPP
jgi:hypothetical protein